MKGNNKKRLTGWSDYVTSTVSVMLVLFILGLVGAINISFHGVSRQIKERMGFTVVLSDSIASQEIENIKALCDSASYISQYKYLSAAEVLAQETGGSEDELVELLGVNPYAPMIEIRMKEAYANVDSIKAIVAMWDAMPIVEETSANTELISNLNRNAGFLNLLLIVVAASLLLISFVLINNTVRLTVYARRFIIHTMKLVGATWGFIRRPFIIANGVQGVIAGILASGLLIGGIMWLSTRDEIDITAVLTWPDVAILCVAMLLAGVIICTLAAYFATNRYLRKNYNEMFD